MLVNVTSHVAPVPPVVASGGKSVNVGSSVTAVYTPALLVTSSISPVP